MAAKCIAAMLLMALFMSASIHQTVLSLDDQLHVVRIDGVNGRDSPECLNSIFPCQSLSFVADNLTRNNSVGIEIAGNLLNLRVPVKFNGYTYLTINGSGSKIALYCNESEAGIAFVNVHYLTIHSLTIENCGAKRNSTSFNPLMPNETEILNVAVYILNCTDVTINHVNIQSSNGTGLSLYDTNGIVNITYCNFINNSVWNKSSQSGGGGLHIEFPLCRPGIFEHCFEHNARNIRSSYIIKSCNFSGNAATYPSSIKQHRVILPALSVRVPRLGRGGGLYISIELDAQSNIFKIINCSFLDNLASLIGGGVLVEFLNSVSNNMVSIHNTSFTGNKCLDPYISTGGGLSVKFMFYIESQLPNKQPVNNSFVCDKCTFVSNAAYTGGGTNIVATVAATNNSQSNINFSQCYWTNNTSPLGAAVYITPGLWDFIVQGFLPIPLFTNCTFEHNSAYQELNLSDTQISQSMYMIGSDLKMLSVGMGAVFISELHVHFTGSTLFLENKGSAVYLSSGVLEFCEGSTVLFHKNKGENGGAVSMHGSSVIRINNQSTINFSENKAYSKGGAIYTAITASLQSGFHNCFIESSTRGTHKSNAVLNFTDNRAVMNGDSIFAASLRSCKIICLESGDNDSYNQILNCTATFYINSSSISTPPNRFRLNERTPIPIKPGIKHSLDLTVYDEGNAVVKGTIYEAFVESPCNDVEVDSQVSDNVVTVRGPINTTAELSLDTADVSLPIAIILDDCQPGYDFNDSDKECVCAATQYLGLEGCDPYVYLQPGHWMGYCNNSKTQLCTSYCPLGFCTYHNMTKEGDNYILPTNTSLLNQQICGPYRTGTACSRCINGRSVYFHSTKYTCGSEELCDWGWLFYLLSEIVPLTIVFVIIIVFNISFTSGYLSSFVLFAQIFDALATNLSGLVQYPKTIEFIHEGLAFLYRPFNLNFFQSGNNVILLVERS